jgi:hypothetical protein
VSTQQKLRNVLSYIRTTPLPLADLIPLMQMAADELDAAEADRARLIEALRKLQAACIESNDLYYASIASRALAATAQYESPEVGNG